MKKQIIEVPDTYTLRAARIFHNADSDLEGAELRIQREVRGLNVTEEQQAVRKIRELRRDLSRQFAKIWQHEHGGGIPRRGKATSPVEGASK